MIPTTERDWFTRGIRQLTNGQRWKFEVEVVGLSPVNANARSDETREFLSQWCIENTRLYWTTGSHRAFWFECEEDAILFSITFGR